MGVICVGGDSRLFQSLIKNIDLFFLLKANETKSLKNRFKSARELQYTTQLLVIFLIKCVFHQKTKFFISLPHDKKSRFEIKGSN